MAEETCWGGNLFDNSYYFSLRGAKKTIFLVLFCAVIGQESICLYKEDRNIQDGDLESGIYLRLRQQHFFFNCD